MFVHLIVDITKPVGSKISLVENRDKRSKNYHSEAARRDDVFIYSCISATYQIVFEKLPVVDISSAIVEIPMRTLHMDTDEQSDVSTS